MDKLTFFKLPLLLALFYFVINLMLMIGVMTVQHLDNLNLFEYFGLVLPNALFYRLPQYLLLVFVSTIALYRCNIHIVTAKNTLLLGIVALVISLATLVVSQLISPHLYELIANQTNYYYSSFLNIFLLQMVIRVIGYLLVGFIGYYFIRALQGMFDFSENEFIFDANNSRNIHIRLFFMLFIFIIMLFSFAIFSYSQGYIYDISTQIFTHLLNLVGILILTIIFYFTVRRSFSCPFNTLQVGRIIKSSLLSSLFLMLINGLIGFGLFVVVLIIAFSARSNEDMLLFILIIGGILQIALSLFIVKHITKRYFSITYNEARAER